jgi:hypothetical protein
MKWVTPARPKIDRIACPCWLVRLGLRAIGWRARPQRVNHRLGLFALLDLRRWPLQEESLLIAPPARILLWAL